MYLKKFLCNDITIRISREIYVSRVRDFLGETKKIVEQILHTGDTESFNVCG